jgi:hypothetical protein
MESIWNSIWNGYSMELKAIPTPVQFHVESMEIPNGIPSTFSTVVIITTLKNFLIASKRAGSTSA